MKKIDDNMGKKYSPGQWSFSAVIRGKFLLWLHQRAMQRFEYMGSMPINCVP